MSTRFRAVVVTVIASLLYLAFAMRIISLSFIAQVLSPNNEVVDNLLAATAISITLFVGCLWVLFFKRRGGSYLTNGLYPSVTIFPYALLTISYLNPTFTGLELISAGLASGAVFAVVCYLLLLTANVLNGAVLYNIPLGQAGKAAQFIFSLISSYLLLVFVFGSPFSIVYRLLAIGIFSFFFSFSALWALQVGQKQLWLSSFAITILMSLVVTLLSIWPLSAVLATVVAVIFLYICLNMALEIREKVSYMIWVEYFLLVVLALLILITYSPWGINGTLI